MRAAIRRCTTLSVDNVVLHSGPCFDVCLGLRRYTKEKVYVCDITNTILNGLLDPQRGFWVNCTTKESTNRLNKTGGTCEVSLS